MSETPVAQEPEKEKRKWGPFLSELLLWAIVSITTAVLLVLMAERFLPENF